MTMTATVALSLPQAPSRDAVCRVRIISPNRVLGVLASAFLTPEIPGATTYSDTPCLTFLIESHIDSALHQPRRFLFDLGIPKELKVLHVSLQDAVKAMGISIDTPLEMTSILSEDGITPSDIESVIISHHHFDHVGDISHFPATSTSLIVGPGFREHFTPGFPIREDNTSIPQSALQHRKIIELDFTGPRVVNIAGIRAIDWVGNGSLWLLDTPGHAIGHISALIRTTVAASAAEQDTWMFLAGDVCHHAGELRPSPHHHLPASCLACHAVHPQQKDDEPFYRPAPGPWHLNPAQLIETTQLVQAFDADPNVLVVLSHDHWLAELLDLFPNNANDWKTKGWDDQARWAFLKDFEGSHK